VSLRLDMGRLARCTRGVGGLVAIVSSALLAAGYAPPTSQGLRHAHGFDWMCAGADRESCTPGHVPKKLFRPLHLPTVAPGAPCPVSPAREVSPAYGVALGPGPAYPVGLAEATLSFTSRDLPPPWGGNKVIWVIAPRYRGPLLVRGHQLDGPWWVGFDLGRRPLAELPFPSAKQVGIYRRQWRQTGTTTRVRASGCYAYQIDGTTFSRVVVFRAAP
jgi:hypothetical protein